MPLICFSNSVLPESSDAKNCSVYPKTYAQNAYRNKVTAFKAIKSYENPSSYREVKTPSEYYNHLFYGRLSANFSQFTLNGFSSTAGEASALGVNVSVPGGSIAIQDMSHLSYGAEMAVGYLWCNMRLEAEFLMNHKMGEYARASLGTITIPGGGGATLPLTFSDTVHVQLVNKTYLGNVYYDLMYSERIRPFITCGLGVSVNTLTLSSLGDNPSHFSKHRSDLAYAAGFGLRIRIFPYCFVTASYRYLGLGLMETETDAVSVPISAPAPPGSRASLPSLKFDSGLNQSVVSVGIMYFI